MEKLNDVITAIDDFVWGPVMLILLVGKIGRAHV